MTSMEYSHISTHPDKDRVGGLLQRFEERFGRAASIVVSVISDARLVLFACARSQNEPRPNILDPFLPALEFLASAETLNVFMKLYFFPSI